MKQLTQMNTTEVIDTFVDTGVFKLLPPYDTPKMKRAFIPHLLALFSTIPLRGIEKSSAMGIERFVSMSAVLREIPDRHITSEGEFTRQQILDYIRIAATVPRSKLVQGSMTKEPAYGALTPLFMYAHKRDAAVKYSSWDWEDSRINAALGIFLAKANDFRKAHPIMQFDIDPKLRLDMVRERKLTEWCPYATTSVSIQIGEDAEQHEEKLVIPREVCIIEYQLWLANAGLRDTSTMILDIYDYGRVPTALDTVTVVDKNEGWV